MFEFNLSNSGGFTDLAIIISIIMAGTGVMIAFNHYIASRVFFILIEKMVGKNRTGLANIITRNRLLHRIVYLIPAIFLYHFSDSFNIIYPNFKLLLSDLVKIIAEVYIILNITFIFIALLNCINDKYDQCDVAKKRPIKSYFQLIKIIISCICIVLIASIIFDKPPIYFLTGVGATTAFFALIFKDLLMGFVSSIQLSAYDMVRIGDWIEMPNFGADGEVMEISLSTVKIQNFDKTIVTIPSYALLTTGLKNWRGMHEAGGRRVKRSIIIDINSIKMSCDQFMQKLNDLKIFPSSIKKENELTNIGWFRIYLHDYLSQHKGVHKNMRILIRQLQGTSTGLPLELYYFTNETDTQKYEAIQSDIIEHVYAVMPRFDLRAFQYANSPD